MKIKVFKCPECGGEDGSEIYEILKHLVKNNKIKCPFCEENVKYNTFESEIGKGMSLTNYIELIDFINRHHSFKRMNGKKIKYIRNNYDTRTGKIYYIKLDEKEFYIVNENSHRNLKDWIYKWLNS